MHESKAQEVTRVRSQALQAMLAASGELGYRNVAVRHVLNRYGGYRFQFYRLFEGKADCYMAAYEIEVERLATTLLGAAAEEGSWRGGLRAALERLAAFVGEQPELARGLLVEVHVAGGRALEKREEVLERLFRALDSARRETEPRHSPPPVTAAFIVGAIEGVVTDSLAKGQPESFASAVPELVQLATVAYFGDEA